VKLCVIAVVCIMLAGCAAASRPIKYYRLDVPPAAASPSSSPSTAGFDLSLQVGNIDAPPIMRDGRILYQVGANEVGAYEYHRWVETPDRVVQNSLLRLLRSSGKYQSVDTPVSGAKAEYIVLGKIYEFGEFDKPESVFTRVSLEIELHEAKSSRTVWSRVYTGEEAVGGTEVPDVVQSLDKNLRRGLSEIVVGLDQYFAGKRNTR
jgi:ABC-type uncharacterized transport system auxiliary subunit